MSFVYGSLSHNKIFDDKCKANKRGKRSSAKQEPYVAAYYFQLMRILFDHSRLFFTLSFFAHVCALDMDPFFCDLIKTFSWLIKWFRNGQPFWVCVCDKNVMRIFLPPHHQIKSTISNANDIFIEIFDKQTFALFEWWPHFMRWTLHLFNGNLR